MCGSLRLKSGERVRPGGDLWVKLASGLVVSSTWAHGVGDARKPGLARSESWGRVWRPLCERGCAEPCLIAAASYFERANDGKLVEFLVPEGKYLAGLVIPMGYRQIFTPGVLIVTRAAETEAEKRVHDRHPRFAGSIHNAAA